MDSATDIARELGAHATSFCRAYLPAGRLAGNYWQVGDVTGAKGASLAIRLHASDGQPAGKWTDYVASRVMLRRGFGWRLRARSACFAQHNPGLTRRAA